MVFADRFVRDLHQAADLVPVLVGIVEVVLPRAIRAAERDLVWRRRLNVRPSQRNHKRLDPAIEPAGT